MSRPFRLITLLLVCTALLFGLSLLLTASTQTASAASVSQEAQPTRIPDLSISDEYCLSCHGEPGQTLTLGNGETFELYVDPEVHANSVHGALGYACVQCHTGVGEYPHPAFSAADARDVALQLTQVCYRCHSGQFERTQDSAHARAQGTGKREAAVCSDCHTAHAVQRLTDPQTGALTEDAHIAIPITCSQCHFAIYEKYTQSVHGKDLQELNPDVPTCIDCHGVHNIVDPTTNQFRNYSPSICSRCHTNPGIMDKYGISTNVLTSYISDFHGTTNYIFAREFPDQEANTPVCYDCHGVHDISRVDDPNSGLLMKKNLSVTCQQCHADANTNFPDAWLGHYAPTPQTAPMVYIVNLFYKIFIPLVLGGMGLLVVMDLGTSMRKGWQKRRMVRAEVSPPPDSSPSQAGEALDLPQAEHPAGEFTPPASGDPPVISTAGQPGEPTASQPGEEAPHGS